MAVADMVKSQLRLTFVTGNNPETGKPTFAYKAFNNVKTTVNAGQLLTIAEALSSLQNHPLYKVERNDSSEISAG